ncbi:MAG TPA: hypothetical protein VNW97_18805 [Candidatus Saccharimonadales bacterium]|jgi:hypothetical protein|nr:hypothetical protein [Candidatus Saccharimonadales bacterium]
MATYPDRTDILKLPLQVRAEMAMKVAVRKVIERAIRDGRAIHILRDGKVVEVSGEELKRLAAPDSTE